VDELEDWESLRGDAAAIKDEALANLAENLVKLEASVEAAGGKVYWARDAKEAVELVAKISLAHGASEVIKVKSITSDEIELNSSLAGYGLSAI
jgi:L-lactate dehydrogenase complex protein LldF